MVVLLGLGLLGNIVQVLQGNGRILGLAISALLLLGVLTRSAIAWWFLTVISFLASLLLFAVAVLLPIPELRGLLFLFGLLYLAVPGLLISARVRGTYF